MNAQVDSFLSSAETLRAARQVMLRPDMFGREDVLAACRYLMTSGDCLDYWRANALMEVLEAEAVAEVKDEQRSLAEIVADMPESEWFGVAVITVWAVAVFWLGSLL